MENEHYESREFKGVYFEGKDHLGKDSTTRRIAEKISEHMPVTMFAYPAYSLPIGGAVRKMLTDDIYFKNISVEEESSIRLGMFALNRLEVANDFLANPEYYQGTFPMTDRGPLSEAITLGYFSDKQEEWATPEKLIEKLEEGLVYDEFMSELLNMYDCVVEFVSEENLPEWHSHRDVEQLDQYEQPGVQEKASWLYDRISEMLSEYNRVAAKDDNGEWYSYEEIDEQCMDIINSKYPDLFNKVNDSDDKIKIVEIDSKVRNLYKGHVVPDEDSLRLEEVLRNGDKDCMYEASLAVSDEIAKSCEEIVWANEDIRKAVRNILVIPNFLTVLERIRGQVFTKKLVKSIS